MQTQSLILMMKGDHWSLTLTWEQLGEPRLGQWPQSPHQNGTDRHHSSSGGRSREGAAWFMLHVCKTLETGIRNKNEDAIRKFRWWSTLQNSCTVIFKNTNITTGSGWLRRCPMLEETKDNTWQLNATWDPLCILDRGMLPERRLGGTLNAEYILDNSIFKLLTFLIFRIVTIM